MKEIKQTFIQDFGEAYMRFGLPKLMGHIVGLLIISGEAKSLDEITNELGVSKGPVSQIMQRLREHNLVQRVWKQGDRKDYYAAVNDIFGIAFKNQMSQIKRNLALAEKYAAILEEKDPNQDLVFTERVQEMKAFYRDMLNNFNQFYTDWSQNRNK